MLSYYRGARHSGLLFNRTARSIAEVPFYKIKAVGKVVIAIAIKNAKPDRADYAGTSLLIQNDRVWNLLSSCWVADPDKRPSVDELIAEVASL